jgi:hypothetical protein
MDADLPLASQALLMGAPAPALTMVEPFATIAAAFIKTVDRTVLPTSIANDCER